MNNCPFNYPNCLRNYSTKLIKFQPSKVARISWLTQIKVDGNTSSRLMFSRLVHLLPPGAILPLVDPLYLSIWPRLLKIFKCFNIKGSLTTPSTVLNTHTQVIVGADFASSEKVIPGREGPTIHLGFARHPWGRLKIYSISQHTGIHCTFDVHIFVAVPSRDMFFGNGA